MLIVTVLERKKEDKDRCDVMACLGSIIVIHTEGMILLKYLKI